MLGLEDDKRYRFRIHPVFRTDSDDGEGGVNVDGEGGKWGWSPASAPASPAVLNAFIRSQVPRQLVAGAGGGGGNKGIVDRTVLAGKIVGTCVSFSVVYFTVSYSGVLPQYVVRHTSVY